MEKAEIRPTIKYFVKKSFKVTGIHKDSKQDNLVNYSPYFTNVHK